MDNKSFDSSNSLNSTSLSNSVSALSLSGKTKHRLACGFTFWYLKKDSGRGVLQTNYQEQIKRLPTFHTVEDFWSYYSHLTRPNDLTISADYNLFREGIVPMWEDAANRNGGKWVVRLKKGMASRCWEDAILALIGDEFNLGDEICGVVLSTKFQEDILSFWTKTADDRELTYNIRETIKKVLGISSNGAMEYKQHQQALKHSLTTPPATDRTIEVEVYEKRERERDERERDRADSGERDKERSGADKERGGENQPRSWDRYARDNNQPRSRNWEQRGVRDWDRGRAATASAVTPASPTNNGTSEKEKDDGWQQVTTRSKRRDERDDWTSPRADRYDRSQQPQSHE